MKRNSHDLQQRVLSEDAEIRCSKSAAPDRRRTGRPSGSIVITNYTRRQFTHKYGLD